MKQKRKLNKEFYLQDALTVAKNLLGKVLVHQTEEGALCGRIIETEAYMGPEDAAAHSYQNHRSKRNEIMFHEGGVAYVYMIYGLHYCMNVVTNQKEKPEAVLIRRIEPLQGIEIMMQKRKQTQIDNLCNGPGKLCMALSITKKQNGEDLCGASLYIATEPNPPSFSIGTGKRIHIDYAGEAKEFPWRFFVQNVPESPCKE